MHAYTYASIDATDGYLEVELLEAVCDLNLLHLRSSCVCIWWSGAVALVVFIPVDI